MFPFFGWGSTALRLQCYYEETVYFFQLKYTSEYALVIAQQQGVEYDKHFLSFSYFLLI